MKIALAQINPTVGALSENAQKILAFADRAREAGAELVVFPELSLCGYPPKDLLSRRHFVQDSQDCLHDLASRFPAIPAVVGFVDTLDTDGGPLLANAAAVIDRKRIISRHHKTLLPAYDAFDESCYFRPARTRRPVRVETSTGNVMVGISICEDMWKWEDEGGRRLCETDPVGDLVSQGAEVLINISASPYCIGKQRNRRELVETISGHFHRPMVFVNQVGGNDSLIFDGGSLVSNSEGKLITAAKSFQEDLLIVSLDSEEEVQFPVGTEIKRVYDALTLGVRDYLSKTGFEKAVIGLSGGIDSALVACLAVEALGHQNVVCVSMPSKYSSEGSLVDAETLAKNLGVELKMIPIKECVAAFEHTLSEEFKGLASDVTEENIQARVRGNLLMALSNKFGWLVLSTGNKSELAVGYCTLYGDMVGGLAVISDVPKTMVYKLTRHANERSVQRGGNPPVPESILTKPPSAELRPNQKDSDSLPEYDLLDAVLQDYVELELSPEEIVAKGFPEQTVARVIDMIDRSEYKRRQAALGLKVTSRAFGFGRRLPIAARFKRYQKTQTTGD